MQWNEKTQVNSEEKRNHFLSYKYTVRMCLMSTILLVTDKKSMWNSTDDDDDDDEDRREIRQLNARLISVGN